MTHGHPTTINKRDLANPLAAFDGNLRWIKGTTVGPILISAKDYLLNRLLQTNTP
jgi:hypothetical protein